MSSNTINEYKNIYYELSNYPTRRKDIKKKKNVKSLYPATCNSSVL